MTWKTGPASPFIDVGDDVWVNAGEIQSVSTSEGHTVVRLTSGQIVPVTRTVNGAPMTPGKFLTEAVKTIQERLFS